MTGAHCETVFVKPTRSKGIPSSAVGALEPCFLFLMGVEGGPSNLWSTKDTPKTFVCRTTELAFMKFVHWTLNQPEL